MELNGSLGGSEAGPGKSRQAQVDGRGVQRVDGVVEFQAEVVVEVQRAGQANQRACEVGVDAPVAFLVGPGERVAGHPAAEAHVVELVAAGTPVDLDIPWATTVGELRERHAEELIEARKGAHPAVAAVALDAALERVERQVVHHLREDELAGVHAFPVPTEVGDRASSQGCPSAQVVHMRTLSLSN